MKNTLLAYIDRFRHDRRQRVMLGSVLLVLAVIVTLLVYWQLRLSGIAMTNETYCGYEEHVHTDECYEYTLICELEEIGHVHDESCYEEQQVLVCGLEETEGHTHSESCYDEEGNLVCGLEEYEGHAHSEACYETQMVLICGQEETPDAHVHTDECYEKTLICELEEHTHTVECLIDLTADVEDETIWSATIPELTGDLRTDIIAIAESQVGYTESTANYSIGEDGITHYGYTRYGAWYGSEYADWDSIFAAFCLDYAGIADEFSYNAGSFAWTVDLANLGYYQSADSYVPSAGDLVFVDTDLDGRADKTAVVVSVDNVFSTVTAIQGNYTVTDVDGNSTDTVAYVTYSMTATAAPVLATISEDGETVDDVTPVILGYANVSYVAEVETTDEEVTEDEVTDEEEIDLEGETDEELSEEEITDEIAEPEVVGSAAVLTYAGEDYTITVTYGEDALIPEGTYLVAYEYSSDSETYLQRYAESAAIYGWEGEPTEDFRVFNIGLYYDGVEIEPAAEIQVSITYTAAENSDSVSVTHHDETAEPLYAVSEYSEETGTETVTFTTDGFSDYSFMLMSTGAEENNGLTATSNDLEVAASVAWKYTSASYTDGSFDINFYVDFTGLSVSTIKDNNYTFYLTLPDGVIVPTNLAYGTYVGYDNSGVAAFDYHFEQVGDVWQVVIVFRESYVSSITGNVADGYVTFEGLYSLQDKNKGETTEINVYSGNDVIITIDGSKVDTDGSENWYGDISVTKTSSSGYSTSSKSITYTVIISSKSGTQNSVNLADVISFVNNNSNYGTLSVKSISIDSVTYYTDYYSDSYYSNGSTASYTDNSASSTSDLDITLDALKGTAGSTSAYTNGDCYVVTYTVYFDAPESGDYNTSISNSATAKSTTDAGEIKDDSTVTKNAISSSVTKTGDYDANTDTITWTITYNETGANIAGKILYDYQIDGTSFADATSGLDINNSGTYEYVYDTNGTDIIGIKFLAVNDTDSDGTPDSNTNTYKITYTTDVSTYLGSSSYTARNIVTVDNVTAYGDETVETGGKLSKILSASANETVTTGSTITRDLTWTSTVTIPAGGIKADSYLADYLGTYGKDYSSYTSTDTTDQWFTYSQITTLFSTLSSNGLQIVGSSGTTVLSYGTDFTLYAYDATSGAWVAYSDITDNGDVYTAYQIYFLKDNGNCSGTVTLTYSTTADISDVENNTVASETYYNSVKIGSLEAYASYTEQNVVYKTDGKNNNADSDATVDEDGELTWIVHLYIQAGSTETYTVVDTLPDGLTFKSATLTINYKDATLTDDDNDGNMSAKFSWGIETAVTGTVESNSVSGTDVTVYVEPDHYSELTTSGGYVTITYKATIDGFAKMIADATAGVTIDIGSYNNEVVVYYGTEKYGDDDQQQDVTYTETDSGDKGSDGHDIVDKSGAFSSGDATLRYEVLLNIDGDKLNNGTNLTFTDVIETYYTGYEGIEIELRNSSVAFYKLYKITYDEANDTGTYTDSNGVTQTITSLSSNIYSSSNPTNTVYRYVEDETTPTYSYYYMEKTTIAWTYSVDVNGGNYTHTITATIPDETSILVLYWYDMYKPGDTWFDVKNNATLTGENTTTKTDEQTTHDQWSEVSTSGGITSGSGITIYKVEPDNYSIAVPGAKFEFYMYDAATSKWVQITQADFMSGTDTVDSTKTVSNVSDTTMTSDNYLVTSDSNGSIIISSTFTYKNGEDTAYAYYDWYQTDTLYYIVEVEAPSGYELLNKEKVYFYWSSDNGTLTYPSDVDQYNTKIYDLKATSLNPTVYVENQPNTSFTLVKVSTTDTSVRLPGATFALYEFHGDADTKAKDGTWTRIGTYVTDSKGEITITFNDNIYNFNHAYKLVEISSPEGYNIGYGDRDNTTFYFYWSSSDTSDYAEVLPSDWASGSTGTDPSQAIDIATKSETVYATNTKTTASVAVKKLWVDENGNNISATGYSTEVQLYWYSVAKSVAESTSSSGSSSTANLVTISSTSSGATAQMYLNNNTNSAIVNGDSAGGNGYYWNTISLSNRASLISALYQTAYSDAYVQIVLQNADDASGLQLIIQNSSYKAIAQVSPTTVTTEGSYTYVTYSTSTIRSALIFAGYSDADTLTADCGGICLNFNSGKNESATLVSFSVLASVDTKAETGTISQDYSSAYSSSGGWGSWFYGDSYADFVLAEGAVIKVAYTNATTDDNIQFYVGIQYNDGSGNTKNASTAVTASGTSGIVYVPVSRILSGLSLSSSDYIQVYVQSNIWASSYGITGFTGTITSLEILVPSTSTISSTTYEIVEDDDTSIVLGVSVSGYPEWKAAFSNYGFGNADLETSLSTSGTIIRVYYTNSLGSDSTLGALIQSYYDDNNGTIEQGTLTANMVTIGTGSSYVDFYVDTFTADSVFDWEHFSWVYLYGYDGVTVTDVQVLIPYSGSSISPSSSTSVTLYNPTTGFNSTSFTDGNYIYDNNYISKLETETTPVVSEVMEEDSTVFSGYGFLDAVYSDSAEYVVIELSNVEISDYSLLSDLCLVIQGDMSVNYESICTVKPDMTMSSYDASNKTAKLYYPTKTMTETELKNSGYKSASDVYADYNGVALQLCANSSFSATLVNIEVIGTVSAYYTESELHSGTPYTTDITDANGNVTGTQYYTYTLDSSNDWSVAVANLPLSYTSGGVEYYCYYYFVEDTSSVKGISGYDVYATYSQIEGEHDGGQLVIVNTLVEELSATVNKVWVDKNGDDATTKADGSNITVQLYYYLTSGFDTQSGSYLETDFNGSQYESYEKTVCDTDNWTWTVTGLPKYKVTDDGTVYTCCYYFVETATVVSGVTNTEYSRMINFDGSVTVTVTNTVSDDSVGYSLPSTGGQNERIYIFIGLALMVLALLGCAYRNIHRIRFSAVSNDTPVRKPSKPGAPSEEKCLRHQKKLSKDRNGDSRAGPKS